MQQHLILLIFVTLITTIMMATASTLRLTRNISSKTTTVSTKRQLHHHCLSATNKGSFMRLSQNTCSFGRKSPYLLSTHQTTRTYAAFVSAYKSGEIILSSPGLMTLQNQHARYSSPISTPTAALPIRTISSPSKRYSKKPKYKQRFPQQNHNSNNDYGDEEDDDFELRQIDELVALKKKQKREELRRMTATKKKAVSKKTKEKKPQTNHKNIPEVPKDMNFQGGLLQGSGKAVYDFRKHGQSRAKLLREQAKAKQQQEQNDLQNLEDEAEEMQKKKQIKTRKRVKPKQYFRVDRILANRGVGTRSYVHQLLKERRVSMVAENEEQQEQFGANSHTDETKRKLIVITGPSEKVSKDATFFLDGTHEILPIPLLLVYNKPKHVLCSMKEDGLGRRHLGQCLPSAYARPGDNQNPYMLHPVGRLDYDTSGLLLFSSNGVLTQRLLHPKRHMEKEYVATVQFNNGGEEDASKNQSKLEVESEVDTELEALLDGRSLVEELEEEPEPESQLQDQQGRCGALHIPTLREQLENGVKTSMGIHTARLLQVVVDGKEWDVNNSLEDNVVTATARSSNHDGVAEAEIRLVVTEGKHRMVRRMLANCQLPVVELRRERLGMVELGDLEVGEFRDLTGDELEWAKDMLVD